MVVTLDKRLDGILISRDQWHPHCGFHNEDVESCQWRPDRGKCTAEDSAPSLASAPSVGGPVLKSSLIIDQSYLAATKVLSCTISSHRGELFIRSSVQSFYKIQKYTNINKTLKRISHRRKYINGGLSRLDKFCQVLQSQECACVKVTTIRQGATTIETQQISVKV